MATVSAEQKVAIPGGAALFHGMPGRLKALYISTAGRTGAWLAEAFAADSAAEIDLNEACGQTAGMERLRDEIFDAILVSHAPGEIDALELVEGYRIGGAEEPIVVLGTAAEANMAVLCYEAGADGYVCVESCTARHLIWTVALAVEKRRLLHENRRFRQADDARRQRELDEARRLLDEQRAAVNEIGTAARPGGAAGDAPLPGELAAHYRQLLRTHVIMGSGNLGEELQRLARVLVGAGVSADQTVRLHLDVVEEMIQGRGARSGRHVMTRADLLVLDVLMRLGEGYRHGYQELVSPRRQKFLPGIDLLP